MKKNEKIYCDVFKSFQYFRLKKTVELANQILDQNVVNNEISKYNLISKASNLIKSKKSNKAQESKDEYELVIQNFEKENKEYNYKLYYNNTLETNINELFKEDTYSLSKLLFTINVIFDKKYDYKGNDDCFKVMSSILYHDSNKFSEIQNQFKQTYLAINKKEFSSLQKGIMIGAGIASIAAVVMFPIAFVGGVSAAAPVTTSALAALGISDMQIGVGIAALGGLLGALAINVLLIDLPMYGYNKKQLINEYRTLSLEDSATLLTIKALLISEAKKSMPKDEYKEKMSEILEIVDDFKSDTEYLLFAENNNILVNKEKMKQFHRWDLEVMKLLKL